MPKLYEALAQAFLAEGVDTQFVLMGDGNMHWSTAFARLPGVRTVHVRHEHATVAAATAYHIATGKIAVASVTCGPGVTQLMTALPAAVRARLPLVVFAGESPINAKFYNQQIDQAPLVTATGARYIAAHSVPRMMDAVREAFHVARYERQPVVLGIPYDLQKVEFHDKPALRDFGDVSAQGRTHAPRSQPSPKPSSGWPRRSGRSSSAGAGCCDPGPGIPRSSSPTAAALCSPTRCPRAVFSTAIRSARHHRQLLHVIGPGDDQTADVVLAVGTSLSYYVGGGHYWGKAIKIQLDDAPAGCATGRRPPTSTSDQMRSSVSKPSWPALTKNWVLANRQRRPFARQSWRSASPPSRRTRCPST